MSENQSYKDTYLEKSSEEDKVNTVEGLSSKHDGLDDILIDLLSPSEEFSIRQEGFSSSSEDESDSEDGSVSSMNSSCCGNLQESRWAAFKKLVSAQDKLTDAFLVMVSKDEKY